MQLFEKCQVEVNLVIGRTIKRSCGRSGHAACGFNGLGKQYKFRFFIGASRLLKNIVPDILRFRQHHRDKIARIVIGGCGCALFNRN